MTGWLAVIGIVALVIAMPSILILSAMFTAAWAEVWIETCWPDDEEYEFEVEEDEDDTE